MDKPTGTFKCSGCGSLWDGPDLSQFSRRGSAADWSCGNFSCGALVRKVSDLPKGEYLNVTGSTPHPPR